NHLRTKHIVIVEKRDPLTLRFFDPDVPRRRNADGAWVADYTYANVVLLAREWRTRAVVDHHDLDASDRLGESAAERPLREDRSVVRRDHDGRDGSGVDRWIHAAGPTTRPMRPVHPSRHARMFCPRWLSAGRR